MLLTQPQFEYCILATTGARGNEMLIDVFNVYFYF